MMVLKSTFPDCASTNEWARFLYYLGNTSRFSDAIVSVAMHAARVCVRLECYEELGEFRWQQCVE